MHMRIHFDSTTPGQTRVELDGTDITKHVLAEDFAIDANVLEGWGPRPIVSLRLKPDTIDIDGDVAVDVLADATTGV